MAGSLRTRTREDAERKLASSTGMQPGTFLLRESHGNVVLSLSDGVVVHHLIVEECGVQVPAATFGDAEFSTFVKHYSGSAHTLPTKLVRML
jgi:hypothetical protein